MATKHVGAAASNDADLITKKVTRGWLSQCKNGEWTRSPGISPTAVDMVDDMMYGTLIVPARDCTVDQMGVNVINAGSNGGDDLFRLGIYTISFDSSGTMSASLLSDAGTVAYATTGVKTVTLGSTKDLKYGVPYMLVVCSQGAPVTNPDISFVQSSHMGMSNSSSSTALSATGQYGWQVASTTGALPSSPTFVTAVSSLPVIAIHCSA